MTGNDKLPQICYICWGKKEIDVETYKTCKQVESEKTVCRATCIRCKGEGVIHNHPTYKEFLEICDANYRSQNTGSLSSLQAKVLHLSREKRETSIADIMAILEKYK